MLVLIKQLDSKISGDNSEENFEHFTLKWVQRLKCQYFTSKMTFVVLFHICIIVIS